MRQQLLDIVGDTGLIEDPGAREPFLREWRGAYEGDARFVVCPSSVAEVASVVSLCAQRRVAIVPQGGNTGLCGGAVSHADELLLSLSRLNRVRDVDSANFSMTVDAGCTLDAAQRAADAEERLLALSLSSEGSCQLGGNLSTNAGGVNVVRYGCARDQVLGLEAVLPDGRVWSQLQGLRKNTAGYDLKQLFIGAEGTLGIITGATLKLFARPESRQVLWLSLTDHVDVLALFAAVRSAFGSTLAAFELIPDIAVEFVTRHIASTRRPGKGHWHVLMECHGGSGEVNADALQKFVLRQLESGRISDAVVAQNEREREALWAVRHNISEAQRHEGVSIKHDIALPVGALSAFISKTSSLVERLVPGTRIVCFGHIGDGNLHFNLSQPDGMSGDAFRAHAAKLNTLVHGETLRHGGTLSAEHGIGLLKRDILADQVGTESIDLMKTIKQAIDPHNLMNPGKVI